MNIEITKEIFLTTEHPSSSYGLPVLLINEEAYGPEDFFPNPKFNPWKTERPTTGYWLTWFLNNELEGEVPQETLRLADKFMSQCCNEDRRYELVNLLKEE